MDHGAQWACVHPENTRITPILKFRSVMRILTSCISLTGKEKRRNEHNSKEEQSIEKKHRKNSGTLLIQGTQSSRNTENARTMAVHRYHFLPSPFSSHDRFQVGCQPQLSQNGFLPKCGKNRKISCASRTGDFFAGQRENR